MTFYADSSRMNKPKSEGPRNIQKTLEVAFRNHDIWTIMEILYSSTNGLLDYICNNLYNISDRDVHLFLPQLW